MSPMAPESFLSGPHKKLDEAFALIELAEKQKAAANRESFPSELIAEQHQELAAIALRNKQIIDAAANAKVGMKSIMDKLVDDREKYGDYIVDASYRNRKEVLVFSSLLPVDEVKNEVILPGNAGYMVMITKDGFWGTLVPQSEDSDYISDKRTKYELITTRGFEYVVHRGISLVSMGDTFFTSGPGDRTGYIPAEPVEDDKTVIEVYKLSIRNASDRIAKEHRSLPEYALTTKQVSALDKIR